MDKQEEITRLNGQLVELYGKIARLECELDILIKKKESMRGYVTTTEQAQSVSPSDKRESSFKR